MLLSIEDLSIRIGDRDILGGISASVDRGGWLGVVGPNGSGKTTLLRAICGFLEMEGRVEIDGRPVGDWSRRDLARTVAFLRQHHELSFEFEVGDLVAMGRTPHKGWLEPTTADDLRSVHHALGRVGLDGFERRSIHSLSGGELQRAFLAQALVQDADLLLLDEPTTHLDVFHQYDFLEHVKTVVSGGRAAVAVFHDLSQAWRYCDRVLVLNEGRQEAFDAPESVLSSELIGRVFKMDSSIWQSDGVAGIAYLRPANGGGATS